MSLFGSSIQNVVVAISIAEIPRMARIVRSSVLVIREQPYVEAAVTNGTKLSRLLWRHVLPNIGAPVIVQATYVFASAMIRGIGAVVPRRRHAADDSELGQHAGGGRQYLQRAPWMIAFPRRLPRAAGAHRQCTRRRPARRARPRLSRSRAQGDGDAAAGALDGTARRLGQTATAGADRRDLSIEVAAGETLCLVGEFRLRQSLTTRRDHAAAAAWRAHRQGDLRPRRRRSCRRWTSLRCATCGGATSRCILQEPMTSLNPVMTIGEQITESVRRHDSVSLPRRAPRARPVQQGADPIRNAGSPPIRIELSGGMRQRVIDRDGARLPAELLACRRADDARST